MRGLCVAERPAPLSAHRLSAPPGAPIDTAQIVLPAVAATRRDMNFSRFVIPEDAQLSDPTILTKHLMEASSHARGSVDGTGFARLLEAAAQALQQAVAEARVQRGLAIASQTLASELAMKCEQLQVAPLTCPISALLYYCAE